MLLPVDELASSEVGELAQPRRATQLKYGLRAICPLTRLGAGKPGYHQLLSYCWKG